ncbi:proprotein convertase P-domain-containing protein, partial [Aequorivita soesokkakensis]|uniref:proprotein convertase P-domain-containing protein n=1 Tax=Aequorivita soesokkakensis TaxID=1385699 RepID=UPI000AB5CC15
MKKITMLILLMVCAIGYSQTDAKSTGSNDPVSFKKVKQISNDGRSSTSLDEIAPLQRNLYGTTSMSASNSTWGAVTNSPAGTASRNMQSDSFYNSLVPVVITHSVSQSIVPGTVTCNAGGIPDENSFYRDFDLANDFGISDDFNVSSVEFGVEEITGPVALTLNIYSTAGPFPTGFPGSLTLQGTANYTVDVPDNLTIVSVPLNATIPAGAIMVYEMKINLGAANVFFPGSNAAGQTGVSWIASAACGITTPTDFAAIGFPNVHMIMNVVGEEAGGGGGGGACGSPILEVNQPSTNTCMAFITQTDLAQSYIPTEPISAGAGIMFTGASTGLNVNLSLWDGLPNGGGTMLASGTSQTDGTAWTDVFWDPVVNVTAGNTYYIVIDGDAALPCVAGDTTNPYPGGNVFANAGYGSFPDFDYTFRTYSCDSGGGGGSVCDQSNPENAFENGRGCSANNNWTAANDIIVATGNDMTLNGITPNIWMLPGVTAASVLVTIYDDAAGLPGTAINSETVVPTSSTVLGSNFGYDISEVVMDLTPVSLPGDAGSDVTYWIAIQVTTSDNSVAFWSMTTASAVGNPLAFSDGTPFVIPDPTYDGVYVFSAFCEPIGGGGTCVSTAYDSTAVPFDIDGAGTSTADCANAPNLIPVSVADAGTIGSGTNLENITIDITHTWSGDLELYLVSPAGTELLLADNLSGNTDNAYNGTMFEDGGADIATATAPFGVGPYEPMGGTFAAAFAGEDITGDWSLKVCDTAGGDTGQVLQFSMSICVPPVITNDDCSNAYVLACGDSVTGETLTATDSGGNAAPDVFYKFTGSGTPQLVTISLCAATDYDSLLRVFDDCDLLNELAVNDDFCGLQSQVTFQSDGTSTYYIMVEGFGSNAGNFSLDVTCEDPLANDDCSGAIAVSCGDSVSGTTDGATIDTGVAPDCGTAVTSPGVWYSLDDNSGLPGTITLSLCSGTDYDSKISVYTGDCNAPPLTCVDGNDDSCGLQSEITFASDGNTSYLILVHGFGGATGNFTLDVTCTPTPPPNDMIVNSIDVDEIGFP